MILKISCGLFIIYYCLVSVIIPSTAVLLTPICGLMMAVVLFYIIRRGHFMLNEIAFPIGCWLIFGIVSIVSSYFTARDVDMALDSALTFVKLTAMLFCVVFISREVDDYEYLIDIMYYISLIYTVYMFAKGSFVGIRLVLGNANSDANVCLIGIVTGSLMIGKKNSRIHNFGIYASLFFFAYVNLMTGSRKSFICMAIYITGWICIQYGLLWKQHKANAYVSGLLLIFICWALIETVVLPIIYNSSTYSRFTSAASADEQEIRINLYKEAWYYFQKSPIFGIGYNQFRVYNTQGIYSHSTYAEILSNCGIIGTLLFFTPHFWCVKKILDVIRLKHLKQRETRNAFLILVYFITTLILATGMVQTNNERVLLMYASIYAFIYCEIERETKDEQLKKALYLHETKHLKYIR